MTHLMTKRLVLRPLKATDMHVVRSLVNDRAISRNFSYFPYPFTMKDAKSFLHFIRAGEKKKTMLTFVIERQEDKQIIGMTRLDAIDRKNNNAELFFWVGRKFQGQGYASEAVQAVLHHAFAKLKLHRVYAQIFAGNKASTHLLQKLGFTHEGKLRSAVKKGKRLIDLQVFSLLSKEFRA